MTPTELRALMELYKVTRPALAKGTGFSKSMVDKWLGYKRPILPRNAVHIRNYFASVASK